jgi:hypothetical protein
MRSFSVYPSLVSLSLALFGTAAMADETTGEILAYDRVAQILVLTDKTVWPLSDQTEVAEDLAAGDRVRIVFASAGESGVGAVSSVTRAE